MRPLHDHWSRKCQIALLTAAFAIGISSCAAGSGSEAGNAADVATAQALVDKFSAPMTSVGLPPLKNKPAPGKKVAIVLNSTPGSLALKDGAVAGAEALGWTAIPVVYDASKPTGLTDAFAQAVDDAPDAVITTALNQTDYAQAAAALKAKGIPVVTSTNTDPVAAPIIANVSDSGAFASMGRLAAAYVIAKLGGKASVAMFNLPSFPALAVYEKSFQDEYRALCAGCPFESHPVQAGDIGTNVPTQVVSAVQRTPSINVAAMGFGAVATGVSGALASAGLSDVNVLGVAPSMDNIAALSRGTEKMWVALPTQTVGWKSIDALARHFTNEPVDVDTKSETPAQILTKDNVGDHPALPEVVDYAGIFKKLWQVD